MVSRKSTALASIGIAGLGTMLTSSIGDEPLLLGEPTADTVDDGDCLLDRLALFSLIRFAR